MAPPHSMAWSWTRTCKTIMRLFFLFSLIMVIGICILNFYGTLRISLDVKWTPIFLKHVDLDSNDIQQGPCRIPITPTIPAYFQSSKTWNNLLNTSIQISTESPLAELDQNDQVLYLSPNLPPANCCLREILRTRSDNQYNQTTDCTPLQTRSVDVKMAEVFTLECNISGNVSVELKAAIPKKDNVGDKIKYWERESGKNQDKQKPISILMLGFDSTSRAHALRSLPKTMEFMTNELNFVDFDQYQSPMPSTLTNFMAILMGLPRPEVRTSCARDWSTPFDACPFILKDFGGKNYVTNFLEDGSGSFNWGGQSGFEKDPTDYYIHRFFLALEHLKKNKVLNTPIDVPHFSLNYTARFIHQFQNTPFFSFTWFAYPFHNSMYALREMDDTLLQFLQDLKGAKKFQGLLERTLIIFFSDHGDRTSFFGSSSPESFIERGAPPLFIRLPEILEWKYPHLKLRQALKYNSKQLTTPFDVHHTLRHVLSLMESSNGSANFSAQLKDRSSLLVPVPEGRTCSGSNIPPANCLCNLNYDYETESTANAQTKLQIDKRSPAAENLLKFATEQLNLMVETSEYRHSCETWTTNKNSSVRFVMVIASKNNVREILMAFSANDGAAAFDARIRINGTPVNIFSIGSHKDAAEELPKESMELVGFSRINKYASQSSCVKNSTDVDKNMKEFCICKKAKSV